MISNHSSKMMTNETEPTSSPYISFYNQNNVIPVRQDTDDPIFLRCRDFLYSSLGVPLLLLRNCDIMEVGPGGGFNAIATSHYSPKTYTFVDAATASIEELQLKVAKNAISASNIEIFCNDFFTFNHTKLYDVVIIEGVLSGQIHPEKMIARAASFVKLGGILVLTCYSPISLLSEACRRLFRPQLMNHQTFESQIEFGVKIFKSHLATLATSTRPVSDWVIDSILQPWEPGAQLSFPIDRALDVLGSQFEFYHSYPRFVSDGRFYKQASDFKTSNSVLKSQYKTFEPFLIDYRVPLDINFEREKLPSNELNELCTSVLHLVSQLDIINYTDTVNKAMVLLENIYNILPSAFDPTKESLREFIRSFPRSCPSDCTFNYRYFASWWGRGQQYLSLVRRY
jgi:2-polyprenyl-3-methyl-5-hydroxy-6-metoxy-1,4-benzoquinol methylase